MQLESLLVMVLLIVFLVVIIVPGVILKVVLDISPIVYGLIVSVGGFCLWRYVLSSWFDKIAGRQAEKHKGECVYYTDTNVFSVNARNDYVANHLKFKAEMRLSTTVDPAQLTYTSIGAVGRFDYKAESLSHAAYPTGNFILKFGEYPVKRIRLSDELLNEAKASAFISRFIEGNEMVLFTKPNTPNNHELSAIGHTMGTDNMKGLALGMNVFAQGMPVSVLSRKDCIKILNWISGKKVK